MIGMDVKLALASIRAAKMRAVLTMFAVIIGVALFVLVSAAIEGLKSSAVEQINDLGGNLVQVSSGQLITEDAAGNRAYNPLAAISGVPTITEKDFNDISAQDGIKAAAPQFVIDLSGTIKRGETTMPNVAVLATNDQYTQAFGQSIEKGEFYIEDNFAVIGSGVAEKLFLGGNPLANRITIRGESFLIRGVLEEVETTFSFGGFDANNVVLIGLDAGRSVTGRPVGISQIDMQLDDTVDVDEFVASTEEILLKNHGGEQDFTVLKQEDLIEIAKSLLGLIDTVAKFMPYILLFVGAVVILLIMRITVTERTREIGIRKSIGATNGNILTQFLAEALVISLAGSVLGVVFAFLAGVIINWLVQFNFVYNVNTLFAVVALGTIIGAVAGLFPAVEAARKDPVEALRHE